MEEFAKMQKEERELLHKQLALLAEKSANSSGAELASYSEQMTKIFTALNA